MKKLSLFLCLCFAANAHAAFEDTGVGARGPGMADAFVAVADDVNTLFYNPAGLGQLTGGELYTDYDRPFTGTDSNAANGGYLAVAQSIGKGRYGTVAANFISLDATNLYDERTMSLGYGLKLDVPFISDSNQWLVGGAIKQLHVGFATSQYATNGLNVAGGLTGQPDPFFAAYGYSSDALGLDAGTLYRFGETQEYALGLDLANFNRPDISLAGIGDSAPFFTRVGASWNSPWALFSVEGRRTQYLDDLTDYEGALGVERAFSLGRNGNFSVRGGYEQGTRQFQAVTAGASYQLKSFDIDYAFNFPIGNLGSSALGYSVGLSMKWGGIPAAPPREKRFPEREAVAQEAPAKAEVQAPATIEHQAPAVPENLKEYALKPPTNLELQALAMRKDLREYARQAGIEAENLVVYFRLRSVMVLPDSYATLDKVVSIAKRYPALELRVIGHSDSRGPRFYNLQVSQERAEAVKEYLVRTGGLDAERVMAVGCGPFHPAASAPEEAGKDRSRSVEFQFLAITPKAYIVKDGDTLKSISEKLYGDENQAGAIYWANEEKLRGIQNLTEGLELELPR